MISTPHVYQELYPNTPETVQKAFQELSTVYRPENSPDIPSYGAEYMVDETFMKNVIFQNFIKEENASHLTSS